MIEVIAGFVTVLNINQQLHPVFFDRQQSRRQVARDGPLGQRHTFFFTHGHIATVINSAVRENNLQSTNQRGALVFSPRAEQLQYQEVAEAVNSDTRQAVGFSGDQTVAVQTVLFRQPVTPCQRLLQTTGKEINVDGFRLIEGPDARTDLRRRRERTARYPFPLVVNNINGFTEVGFTFHTCDSTGKYPWMAAK